MDELKGMFIVKRRMIMRLDILENKLNGGKQSVNGSIGLGKLVKSF